jgi:molecular chaperone GrpE
MTDPNSSHLAGPDEKTTVLPETAVALVEMERLQQELQASEERAKNHWEQYLRALADVGKRPQARREGSRKHAPVRDREIRTGPHCGERLARTRPRELGKVPEAASLVEGQKATLRLLSKAFEKAQIEEINPEGDTVQSGAARSHDDPAERCPPNSVLSVVQRGYQLNGRLLRPARVIVSAPKS